MATKKKVPAVQNPRTGSYTVRVPKSAATGNFVVEAKTGGKLILPSTTKKSA